eukprot:2123626-Rhodomonas_salina.1
MPFIPVSCSSCSILHPPSRILFSHPPFYIQHPASSALADVGRFSGREAERALAAERARGGEGESKSLGLQARVAALRQVQSSPESGKAKAGVGGAAGRVWPRGIGCGVGCGVEW